MLMKLTYEDFNIMSGDDLKKIPGIGTKTMKCIISMRPFRSNDDLFKVRGLGKGILKKIGIEKTRKKKNTWHLMYDGIEYPSYCLAYDIKYNKLDFFWRIPKDRRQYL